MLSQKVAISGLCEQVEVSLKLIIPFGKVNDFSLLSKSV